MLNDNTYHIHLVGIVQGVGFRPRVYKYALEKKLKGYVCNAPDGLHIEFNANAKKAKKILDEIITQAPNLSHVTSSHIYSVTHKPYTDFVIKESKANTTPSVFITPDYATCLECRKEINDKSNRRFHYPFTTCTDCGPRFSILCDMPYDRVNTTMHPFTMCDICTDEYHDITNRRHYSQTNSCSSCGITMSLYGENKECISSIPTNIFTLINQYLHLGKILAIKGDSGFVFICDATNKSSIENLRHKKYRPSKPFAVMIGDLNQIKGLVEKKENEIQLLKSSVAPIVLMKKKKENNFYNGIAPRLLDLGIMLPNNPFFEILLKKFGKPIIVTSANISGSPITYQNQKALKQLYSIADYVLTNNREIKFPQDDSVIRYSSLYNKKIILRRSKGLAPSFLNYQTNPSQSVLALGALLKSSFTLLANHTIYVSQSLGNTDSYEAQINYRNVLKQLLKICKADPPIIICDFHPQYFSSELAKEMSIDGKHCLFRVQHHKAHFASILAENNLLDQNDILGVIWDGNGLGDDKCSWGGEFFIYTDKQMKRIEHFDYFSQILGDKMAKEPRMSALSLSHDIMGAEDFLISKFSREEWKIYNAILKKNNMQTSSCGRIFDAVASLLQLVEKNSFEGEAALNLENSARSFFLKNGYSFLGSYFTNKTDDRILNLKILFKNIISDLQNKKPQNYIAAKFHYSLTQMILYVAQKMEVKKIAFSGGVFQNSVLVDLLIHRLSGDFELYFHNHLSPNDENISFGQLVYYQNNVDGIQNHNET